MSIFNHFNHLALTSDQDHALRLLETFINSDESLFMLKGYAGSGKTTVLQGVVEYLESIHQRYVLIAPTGRAAKVLSEKTGKKASTVHKCIYSYSLLEDLESKEGDEGSSFMYYYKLANNTKNDVIYIVDEASMISDNISMGEFFRFGSGFLLTDLMNFSHLGELNSRNKIIFVGDPCQLEPVGDPTSRALDEQYIKEKFGIDCKSAELREVKRQGEQSGILRAASRLRKSQSSGYFNDFNLSGNSKDIFNPSYESFLDTWQQTPGKKIIIAYKNKTCLDLNIEIRKRLFGNGEISLQKSDIIILGANNYAKEVFNGEFAVISNVSDTPRIETINIKKKTGAVVENRSITLKWRAVELVFPDSENSGKIVSGQVLENFLYGDNYLHPDEMRALYIDFKIRHPNLKPRTEEFKEAIVNDPYFHCLKIKYGYAVTCHKAQGGEWENVFTVWDYPSYKNKSFYRWAYTAVTRASKKLFAVNPPFFNSYSAMAFVDTEVSDALEQLTGKKDQAEIVIPDKELIQQLSDLNLLNQPLPLQDHFIRVRHAVRKNYIEISGWEKLNYEIRYTFQREQSRAVYKTYVTGQHEFKSPVTAIPRLSTDSEFNRQIDEILKHMPEVSVKRDVAETVLDKIEFDIDTEEQFPFTRSLFDDLVNLFEDTDISIDDIEHQQYKERYTFRRNHETAVIDFEYKKNGFFGRILPVRNLPDSRQLISDIKEALQTFKHEEYAG